MARACSWISLFSLASLLWGCVGEITGSVPSDGGMAQQDAPAALSDAARPEADAEKASAFEDARPPPDAMVVPDAAPQYRPLEFNIIVMMTSQSCGSCGIWFDWQDDPSQKPALTVEYDDGNGVQTAFYQHGHNGMDNAYGHFISNVEQGRHHALSIKQTPGRRGLFRVDISDIPDTAQIVSATLYLHIHSHEGLANADWSSVLAVHECARQWNWDAVSWSNYDTGLSWGSSGGDVGAFIREIRANEDLQAKGYNKGNPDAYFDFTAYVQQLQANR